MLLQFSPRHIERNRKYYLLSKIENVVRVGFLLYFAFLVFLFPFEFQAILTACLKCFIDVVLTKGKPELVIGNTAEREAVLIGSLAAHSSKELNGHGLVTCPDFLGSCLFPCRENVDIIHKQTGLCVSQKHLHQL